MQKPFKSLQLTTDMLTYIVILMTSFLIMTKINLQNIFYTLLFFCSSKQSVA